MASADKAPSWEGKLAVGAKELLSRLPDQWLEIFEILRQQAPSDCILDPKLKDLNWWGHYRSPLELVGGWRWLGDQTEEGKEELLETASHLAENQSDEVTLSFLAELHSALFAWNGLPHPYILLRRIRRGEDQALFDYAKVDKTILGHRWVQDRIREAQLNKDSEFFRLLGNAILCDPRGQSRMQARNLFLFVIATQAKKHLTMPEVADNPGKTLRNPGRRCRNHSECLEPGRTPQNLALDESQSNKSVPSCLPSGPLHGFVIPGFIFRSSSSRTVCPVEGLATGMSDGENPHPVLKSLVCDSERKPSR